MRIVVTGATGNVGSRVVERLCAAPEVDEVLGIARRLPEEPPRDRVRYVRADVATDDMAAHFAGAHAVVHLAWLFQPTHRPLVTWQANALGSGRVFDAAVRAGVGAIVHASSVGAYSPRPTDDHRVDEGWPTDSLPTCAYGREKAYAERLLDVVERDHPSLRVVRLRPAFIFQRSSATQQRRLFMGPFVPGALLRPGRLPVVPYPAGLRFQGLHTEDVADAYVRAALGDARGPFNLAADDVIDGPRLARVLGGRGVPVPSSLVRSGLAAAWHAHLVPADPSLFDLAMGLPLMDADRANRLLGWCPEHRAVDALEEMVRGLADGAGGATPPLAPDDAAHRMHELATGVGEHP